MKSNLVLCGAIVMVAIATWKTARDWSLPSLKEIHSGIASAMPFPTRFGLACLRAMAPTLVTLWLSCLTVLVIRLGAPGSPAHGHLSEWGITPGLTADVGLAAMALGAGAVLSVVLFNVPKVLVPPALRLDKGLVGQLTSRDA